MRKYIFRAKELILSGTAKDTYFLFVGNVLSAIWGLFFTLFVARALTITEFGIFSAAVNLVNILVSITDIGISSGSVNFVAAHLAKDEQEKANEYIKASFIIRLVVVLALSILVIIFSTLIAPAILATNDYRIAVWAAIVPVLIFPDMFFPPILQAKGKFLPSTIIDNVFYIGRLGFAFIFYVLGRLNITLAFASFIIGFILEIILIFYYLGTGFWFSKPTSTEYKSLLKFSGWLGVNRIISSISGKLDISMLAAISGAIATGIYSIASRISSFIIVLSGSFAAVLATRMASFGDKSKEKDYMVKTTLALVPITLLIIIGILIAKPFIILAFGSKYADSVDIFKALAASQIPFLFTVPPVTAIIYGMKKTVYIGALSFFQLGAIFALNFILIPRFGVFGPTITFGVTNILLAIYVWWVAIKYYYLK